MFRIHAIRRATKQHQQPNHQTDIPSPEKRAEAKENRSVRITGNSEVRRIKGRVPEGRT